MARGHMSPAFSHLWWCCPVQVTSQEKAPAVIAKVLEKHSQDPATASQYQLVQLLPEDRGECCRELRRAAWVGPGG